MKPKHIITLTACLFFLFTSFSAMAGERVYILYTTTTTGKVYALISENGAINKVEIGNEDKPEGVFTAFTQLIEKYLQQGYKIISNKEGNTYTPNYILEKP